MSEEGLTVSTEALADSLPYQLSAVRKALSRDNLRPRILLADAVGLGKTLEIGMILAELVRRGRGERILVVTPRHVLEQMQFELWTRFALPFVRLDSLGIQRVQQKLPANRNPFTYFKRAIVSIDTLKSDRYLAHLEKQHWDAVVIDESHNVTNDATQNNRLARLLSSRSDALILASATPHNGKKESFAELIRMLEPSAVTPENDLIESELARLIVRRHRHSPEVAEVVGADWAERLEPNNVLVDANPAENAVAEELEHTWLHPEAGASPYSGSNSRLFPWTLAKAFLSSPAALQTTVSERLKRLEKDDHVDSAKERAALATLGDLAVDNLAQGSAKYDALLQHLKGVGVNGKSTERAVIFAERVSTLGWLRDCLTRDLKLKDGQLEILHGGISDVEQQVIVESFKQESSPIRILVTGDVASEGVNLHLQCHQLIHFDIPWSLIRIEQRNGRIDRYGQKHNPQITTLLLNPSTTKFGGDIRVLQRLVAKEHEAHQALGDSASLMGEYTVKAEEDAIREVLAGRKNLDDVVRSVDDVAEDDGLDGMLARLMAMGTAEDASSQDATAVVGDSHLAVYTDDVAFLEDALALAFTTPSATPKGGGVSWRAHPNQGLVEFAPSADLRQRLEVLPQSYLRDRKVTEKLILATTPLSGNRALTSARSAESTSLWPEAHFLSPLHPCLEWAADRALESLGRNEVYAVEGSGSDIALLLQGTLTNKRGQVVASSYITATFLDAQSFETAFAQQHTSMREALKSIGALDHQVNRNALLDHVELDRFIKPGVRAARGALDNLADIAATDVETRVEQWNNRVHEWQANADQLAQRLEIKSRRMRVDEEESMVKTMLPDQRSVRPLLLVVPVEEGNA
ncbi:SNF2-related protein [Nocardioides salsibiostraticola]